MALFKLAAVGAAGYALWKYVQRDQARSDKFAYPTSDGADAQARSDAMRSNPADRSEKTETGAPSFPASGLPGTPI